MIVYLLHFSDPRGRPVTGGHYLGIAEDERAIDTTRRPHGRGVMLFPDRGLVYVADVWECAGAHAAQALRAKLGRQGSRKRLCSICSPGNARGAGRGNWDRTRAGREAAAR